MESQVEAGKRYLTLVMCTGRLGKLQSALETVMEQTLEPMLVLLVDTGVDKDTTEWLKTETKNSALLSVENIQGAASIALCWNVALEWAFLNHGQNEALVMDSNIELLPETYETLLNVLESGEQSIGIVTAVRVRDRAELKSDDAGYRVVQIDNGHLDFNCFMITREAWELGGRFDERHHGREGHDFECRMKRKGLGTAVVDVPFLYSDEKLFQYEA